MKKTAENKVRAARAGTDRIYGVVVKIVFVIAVLIIWEVVAKNGLIGGEHSELVFPTLEDIGAAFVRNFVQGYAGVSMWIYIGNSMKLLLIGLLIGIGLAFVLSGLSIVSRTFWHIYNFAVTIFC